MKATIIWIVLLQVFEVISSSYKIPPLPVWPENYKACVSVQTQREFITAGWYVESSSRRMRLDSYGIPDRDADKYAALGERTDPFEYACEQFGQPLYVFIYHFNEGKEYDIFPSAAAPYKHCTVKNITAPFPPSPLLPGLDFIEEREDNMTTFYHWRAEYFLFTMDYLFHKNTGLPYKMYVNAEENKFLSFDLSEMEDNIFSVPEGLKCTPPI